MYKLTGTNGDNGNTFELDLPDLEAVRAAVGVKLQANWVTDWMTLTQVTETGVDILIVLKQR